MPFLDSDHSYNFRQSQKCLTIENHLPFRPQKYSDTGPRPCPPRFQVRLRRKNRHRLRPSILSNLYPQECLLQKSTHTQDFNAGTKATCMRDGMNAGLRGVGGNPQAITWSISWNDRAWPLATWSRVSRQRQQPGVKLCGCCYLYFLYVSSRGKMHHFTLLM